MEHKQNQYIMSEEFKMSVNLEVVNTEVKELDPFLEDWEEEHTKYILNENEVLEFLGRTLYRIVYKDGTKGGWLESYDNLSQEGDCKVLNEAKAYGDSQIYENAVISGNARIEDSNVCGNSKVEGSAIILDSASVYENAVVSDNAVIIGEVNIHGNSKVYKIGRAHV